MTRYLFPFLSVCLVVYFAACEAPTEPEVLPPDPEVDISVPDGFTVEVFAEGLDLPTSMAFPPDGSDRLFVNELQSGRIWIFENGERLDEPFAEIETNVTGGFPVQGENGLLGIEFDPNYANNGYVYVTYAVRTNNGEVASVARFTDNDNRGEDIVELLTDLPSDKGHQIQSLRFGPDDKLYVSVGDAYEEQRVQDPESFHGKLLRMNRDGTIPEDNPLGPDSYIYAMGFRNAFDFVFRDNGDLILTDNGPTGLDRLHVVEPGGNYGWPDEMGDHDNPDFIPPRHVWIETVAPTGMHIYRGDQFPETYQNQIFQVLFGYTYSEGPNPRGKRIQVIRTEGDGQDTEVEFEDFAVWQFEGVGNPVDLAEGPDGSLYVNDMFQGTIYRIRAQE